MIPFDTALPFFAASVVLALAPGPDNVFVLLHSAAHGRRAGLVVVLGLCSGLLFHTAAVALGLAAVFAASATAFLVLKLVGAAYLVWLAWQSWRAPVGAESASATPALSAGTAYRRGVLMNVTNPKVAIFFMAFLPQFTNPAQGSMVGQIMQLGALFMLAALITFSAIAFFAATVGQKLLRSPRVQHRLNRTASVVFIGLAMRLAMTPK